MGTHADNTPLRYIKKESQEDYLKAIYQLTARNGGATRSAELARFMNFSRASVSRAIASLRAEGLLSVDDDFNIRLTERGLREALYINEKNCFFEKQLLEAGVDKETARREACRMEHAISNSSFEKLVAFRSAEKAPEEGARPQQPRENRDGPRKRLVLAAKEKLDNGYAEKFSLKELAEKLYVNEDYLGRTFKTVAGITPLQYHNYVRCENARALLEKQENSVESVAYKVGYVSTSHFIKVFRSIYGETPLHYKKRSQG